MYVVVWEFQLAKGAEKQFNDAYGPRGLWAELFGKGGGYLRTELLHDATNANRYVTIDYWTSQQAYETFRSRHADEYAAIDLLCESLTAQETHFGSFTTFHL